jgi:D-xylose transport system substrate-binding protein
MSIRRVAALSLSAVLLLAACSTGGGASSAPSAAASAPAASEPAASASGSAAAADCKVGVSWNNFKEERWAKWDEPNIKQVVEGAGGSYVGTDAGSSAEKQATDVEQLITDGAKVIIILAQDGTAIQPTVQAAVDQGIPVIAYDRLIENEKAFYITFDNPLVGQLMAEEIIKVVPKGNYVIIKGNSADANSDFLRSGIEKVIGPSVTSGDIKIVGEDYTDNWDAAIAQTTMEQFLTAEDNKIDAAIVLNDGMAGGVVAALKGQGLDGKVPVTGQDADKAALNRVALGTQLVSVGKDARLLGAAAGTAAVALCSGTALADVAGAVQFETPEKKIMMSSIFLQPEPITKANLQTAIDNEWATKEELCKDVPAGSVPPC